MRPRPTSPSAFVWRLVERHSSQTRPRSRRRGSAMPPSRRPQSAANLETLRSHPPHGQASESELKPGLSLNTWLQFAGINLLGKKNFTKNSPPRWFSNEVIDGQNGSAKKKKDFDPGMRRISVDVNVRRTRWSTREDDAVEVKVA